MNKKALVGLIVVVILIAGVVVTLFSCGAFTTPKMQVYNLITENNVVSKSRETEIKYDTLVSTHNVSNSSELKKVNNLVKLTTKIVDELTPYVLFVKNTDVSDKDVQNAYQEYLAAKKEANKILQEALVTSPNANWSTFFKNLTEKYSKEAIKYNIFANELLNYVNKACFESNPKTLKFTVLSFMQGFNSYMVVEYIAGNRLSNNTIVGITENDALYNKYLNLKKASKEIFSETSLKFIESFYKVENIKGIYSAFSKGSASLNKFVYDPTNYKSENIQVQKQACENIYEFVILPSFIA